MHPASGRLTADGAVDARSRCLDELRGFLAILGVIGIDFVVAVVVRVLINL
jgi:hypothetical protein